MHKRCMMAFVVSMFVATLCFANGEVETQKSVENQMNIKSGGDQTTMPVITSIDEIKGDEPLIPSSTMNIDEMKQYIPDRCLNVVTDLHATTEGEEDQSALFQKGINQLAAKGGGYLEVPQGVYYLNGVKMASHVVIKLDKDAEIHQYMGDRDPQVHRQNFATFLIGNSKDTAVTYTGIWCEDGYAKCYIPPYPEEQGGIRTLIINNVQHFVVSGLEIFESKTKFCTINIGGVQKDSQTYIPATDGYVANIITHNCIFGYGLVQVQGGQNIYFENLRSEGGVCLRLETGYVSLDDNTKGTLDQITARNLYCENGEEAVMMSPYTNKNGLVQIENIQSVSCAFALKIVPGFVPDKVSKKYPNILPGSFKTGSYVRNIQVIYGEHAQVRKRPEMSETVLSNEATVPESVKQKYLKGETYEAFVAPDANKCSLDVPSIAPIDYTAPYTIAISQVTWFGFQYLQDLPHIVDASLGEISTPEWFTTTVH